MPLYNLAAGIRKFPPKKLTRQGEILSLKLPPSIGGVFKLHLKDRDEAGVEIDSKSVGLCPIQLRIIYLLETIPGRGEVLGTKKVFEILMCLSFILQSPPPDSRQLPVRREKCWGIVTELHRLQLG